MAFSDFRTPGFLALIGLALLLRISFLSSFHHTPVSDEAEYLALAAGFIETGSYSLHGVPTAFRPPGYPALLAAIQKVFGPSIPIIRFLQAFLDIGTVIGLYALGLSHGRFVGLLAGLIWALFPPAILYSSLVLSETASAFLLVALFVAFRFKTTSSSVLRPIAAGILTGLLILFKPMVMLFAVGAGILLWVRTRSRSMLLWFGAGVFIIVTPWVIRNYLVFGSPMISSNTGINLFMGNNPDATGAYRAGLPDTLLSVSGDEMAFDQLSARLAMDHILGDPVTFAVRIPLKIAHTFRSEGELLVWAFHANIRDKASSFSDKYRSLSSFAVFGVHVLYAFILLAGLLGILRFRQDEVATLAILFLSVLLSVHAIFFGGSRFHFLLMPFMALFAARVLPSLGDAWGRMSWIAKFVFGLSAALLVAVWTLEFIYVFW